MTANGCGLALGVMKMSTMDCGYGCTTLNTLKTIELYALNVKSHFFRTHYLPKALPSPSGGLCQTEPLLAFPLAVVTLPRSLISLCANIQGKIEPALGIREPLVQCFLNLSLHWNHLEELSKHRLLGSTPMVLI